MKTPKLPADFAYLPEMYQDEYFPDFLVDKIKGAIQRAVRFIEEGNHSTAEIQGAFDEMTLAINDLEADFADHDSELETGARESIADTVGGIIAHFGLDIDLEDALQERDW